MIRDRGQKEMLYRHFRAQGWFAQVEVPIFVEDGVESRPRAVTDVDVLGIRPSPDLRWETVVGDCKTKKKESPVNRVLWAAGLMNSLGAVRGVVLLKRSASSRIERDHKLFADERSILLLEEAEFADYDRAIVYPGGSEAFPHGLGFFDSLSDTAERFPRLREFTRWILSEAWKTRDHAWLLRATIARSREVRGELDPRQEGHLALALEAAATFAVPFASLVGKVFRRHIKPADRDGLGAAVRVLIWGGHERYEFYNRMRSELIQARPGRGGSEVEPLGLPEWERFLELLRFALEAPGHAFRCPQALRSASSDVLGHRKENLRTEGDRNVLNLAMRVAIYVARGAGFPAETVERIKGIFVPRISEVVEEASRRDSDGQLTQVEEGDASP